MHENCRRERTKYLTLTLEIEDEDTALASEPLERLVENDESPLTDFRTSLKPGVNLALPRVTLGNTIGSNPRPIFK